MKHAGAIALLLLAAAVAGCDPGRHDTAVLGGSGQDGTSAQARDRAIPPPPAPTGVQQQWARIGDEAAVALWIADDRVMASRWTRAGGWTAAAPLESIYGQSSEVEVVGNGEGQALAVWHHRVGNIHSLRFSRLQGDAWSTPDVVPGALPRPAVAGTPPGENAVQLRMDAQGNVAAKWPSGFHANEMQVARYTAGQGWSEAASEAVASAPSASPPSPAPSSAR